MRSVPLGQSAGAAHAGAADRRAARRGAARGRLPDDERQAFTPMLAILSAQHETQYSRLFRS